MGQFFYFIQRGRAGPYAMAELAWDSTRPCMSYETYTGVFFSKETKSSTRSVHVIIDRRRLLWCFADVSWMASTTVKSGAFFLRLAVS